MELTYPRGVYAIYLAELVITSPETRSGERPETSMSFTSFEPIPDRDVWAGDINETMTGGETPSYLVKGLDADLIRHGPELFMKTAKKRVIDAVTALAMARIKCPDLWFYTPRPAPSEGAAVSRIAAVKVAPELSRKERREAQEAQQLGFDFRGNSDG
jgi:hypothetical protein